MQQIAQSVTNTQKVSLTAMSVSTVKQEGSVENSPSVESGVQNSGCIMDNDILDGE